jgi:hypothetical protein
MFVRKKGTCHYLVNCQREGGKVRQKVLAYLGCYTSAEAAMEGWKAKAAELRKVAEEMERAAAAIAQRLGKVPERPQGRRGAQFLRKLASRYWWNMDRAAAFRKWAGKHEAAAAKLARM